MNGSRPPGKHKSVRTPSREGGGGVLAEPLAVPRLRNGIGRDVVS